MLSTVINHTAQLAIAGLTQLYHFFITPTCLMCKEATCNTPWCNACLQDLPILTYSCPQCARLLPPNISHQCGNCLQTNPPFERTLALCHYEPPLPALITGLKFRQQLSYAYALGKLLTHQIKTKWYKNCPLPTRIIPMPLHIKRLQQRGYNQAVEIAKPIAKTFNLPLDTASVQRIKNTHPQSALSATARRQNIYQAFSSTEDYQGQSIAVVDDVITTGHTMREFCTLLKSNNAGIIHVWCCARR